MIVGQVTETWVGTGLLVGVVGALVGWIGVRRPAWAAVWPMLLTPLPWISLIVWAASHWRETGPQTGFHADRWGLVMLGATVALSVWAIVGARRVRWPVAGLCVVNFGFALIAALFAVMMTTGVWL